MNILELRKYLGDLIGQISFSYNGQLCGIDPLALDSFDMWYGAKTITASSVDEVMDAVFFDGKTLKDIWPDVTDVDF